MIDGYTAQLGAQHTDTLMAKMNLANLGVRPSLEGLLQNLGERDEARRLYTEVIDGYTAQLGAEHTDTLGAKMGLATLLQNPPLGRIGSSQLGLIVLVCVPLLGILWALLADSDGRARYCRS